MHGSEGAGTRQRAPATRLEVLEGGRADAAHVCLGESHGGPFRIRGGLRPDECEGRPDAVLSGGDQRESLTAAA